MRRFVSRHAAFGALLLGFAILYGRTLHAYGMFMWDEAEYASIARSLLRGEGFAIAGHPNHYRLPVLPLAAAASMAVARSADDVVLKRASVAFALLALAVVYGFACAEYGRTTGLVAAAILGLLPGFWGLTAVLMTEMPFLAFFAGALFAFHRALYVDRRFFLGSGACAALALLTRYTGVLLGPACLVLFMAALLGARGRLALWRDPYLLLGIGLGLAILLPWLVRQQAAFGDAAVGFRYASGQLAAYLPGVTLPWHFYFSQLPRLVSAPVVVLALFGLGWAIGARDRFAISCALVVGLLLVWFSVYRYKELRLISSAMPFVAMLAALGLTAGGQVSSLPRKLLVVSTLALVAVVGWVAVRQQLATSVTLGYPSFLDAMRYLRRHARADGLLVGAAGPQIAWYADRRVVDFPEPDALPELLDRAEWLVITSFERGQAPYAGALAQRVTAEDLASGAVRFSDQRYQTLLVPAPLMRSILERERRDPGNATPDGRPRPVPRSGRATVGHIARRAASSPARGVRRICAATVAPRS